MSDAFKRRQLLLRREDGTPAGFVRIEQDGSRCMVEIRADGVSGEAKALLLSPEGKGIRPIGTIVKGKANYTMRVEDMQGFTQAAVMAGDKLLLIGGEGAGFRAIRKLLSRQPYPGKASTQAANKPGADKVGVETRVREDAGSMDHTGNGRDERQAPAEPQGAAGDEAAETMARACAEPEEDVEEVHVAGGDATPVAEAVEWAPPQEGWVIMPYPMGNAPERIVGHYYQAGQVQSTLRGIAGAYAPEPPPGLTGYVWDGGFWIHVEAAEA